MQTTPTIAPVTAEALPDNRRGGAASDRDLEIATLKGELQTLKTFHDSILATVHWALGGVAGLAALLVGYNWFTNYRMASREKEALQQEISGLAEKRLAEIKVANADHITTQLAEAEKKSTSALEELSKTVAALQKTVAKNSSDIRVEIRQAVAAIRCEVMVQEAKYWQTQGVRANELHEYIELIPHAVEADSDFHIDLALGEIIRLMKAGTKIESLYVSDFIEMLKGLPKKYAPLSQTIQDLIAKA